MCKQFQCVLGNSQEMAMYTKTNSKNLLHLADYEVTLKAFECNLKQVFIYNRKKILEILTLALKSTHFKTKLLWFTLSMMSYVMNSFNEMLKQPKCQI